LPITIAGTEYLFGGDIIVAINGRPFTGRDELTRLVGSLKVGDKVRLKLYYQGKTREAEMQLTERPLILGDF
jgi:S1-C subfamily serine protease